MQVADDTHRILVVDDNEAGRYRKRRLLERAGLRVLEASTGAEALELINHRRPPLVLLDVKLPDISGLDIARYVAETCPAVKLLALTVHEDRAYVQLLLQAGCSAYLVKPIDMALLLHELQLARRTGQNF